MLSPTTKTPQQDGPAQLLEGHPTFHGQPPAWAQSRFTPAPPGAVPEFCKLPAPRERCPFSGASRSWLIDQAAAGNIRLVRVRQPGKIRGAVFVHVPSLLDFLRREMEQQNGAAQEGGAA